MYRIHAASGVIKDGVHIKPTRSDPRWLEYQQWVKAGNIPDAVEIPVQPLQAVLNNIVAKIKQKRDTVEQSGFSYLGQVFDSNPISAIRINGASQAALVASQNNIPFAVGWTAKNNTVVPLTINEMIAMPLAMASHANSCHEHARTLLDSANALFSSENRAALEAFDLETGWPTP